MRDYIVGDYVTIIALSENLRNLSKVGQNHIVSSTTKEMPFLMNDRVWLDGETGKRGVHCSLKSDIRPRYWWVNRVRDCPISKRVIKYLDRDRSILGNSNDPCGFIKEDEVWYVGRFEIYSPPPEAIYLTLEEWDAFNYDGLSTKDSSINNQTTQTMNEVKISRKTLTLMYKYGGCGRFRAVIKEYLMGSVTCDDDYLVKISQDHIYRLNELNTQDTDLVKKYLPKDLFKPQMSAIEIAMAKVIDQQSLYNDNKNIMYYENDQAFLLVPRANTILLQQLCKIVSDFTKNNPCASIWVVDGRKNNTKYFRFSL